MTDQDKRDVEAANAFLAGFTSSKEGQSFSGFLAHHMIEATTKHSLDWTEAIFAAGLAARMLGEVAALAIKNIDGTSAFTPEQTKLVVIGLLKRAMSSKVSLMKADSREQFDALAEAMDELGQSHATTPRH